MYATLDIASTVRFEFKYDLANNSEYSTIAEGHNVVVELVSGSFKNEKIFKLEE